LQIPGTISTATILLDIFSDILSGVLFDILPDIFLDILPGIPKIERDPKNRIKLINIKFL